MAWPGASLPLFPGLSPQQLCPQGSSDCRKQCEPDYYLSGQDRCTACVSCGGKSPALLQGSFQGPSAQKQRIQKAGSIRFWPLYSELAPWCLSLPRWVCEMKSAVVFCIRPSRRDLVNMFPQGGESPSLSLIFATPRGEDSVLIPALQGGN